MAVETAADRAAFFNEEEFAEAAVYRSKDDASPGTRCSIVVDRGQGRKAFAGTPGRAVTDERLVQARRGELAAIARDGTFTLLDEDEVETDEVLTIAGMPKLDETGQWWVAEIVIGD